MGLFRRSKRAHVAADPLEGRSEARELSRDGIENASVPGETPYVRTDPEESDLAEEELIAASDPEDDTSRELLIERERDRQEPNY